MTATLRWSSSLYALNQHMTVYHKMAFGLQIHKTPTLEICRRADESARTPGIESLLARKLDPHVGLSNLCFFDAETQRAAVGGSA